MDNDWDSVVDSVYPDGSGLTGRGANGPETRTDDPARQAFDYFWLVVNTRSFYWDRSRPLNGASRASAHRDAKDCMALSPWADLFNHTDEGVIP